MIYVSKSRDVVLLRRRQPRFKPRLGGRLNRPLIVGALYLVVILVLLRWSMSAAFEREADALSRFWPIPLALYAIFFVNQGLSTAERGDEYQLSPVLSALFIGVVASSALTIAALFWVVFS